jgi:hypothetical protein
MSDYAPPPGRSPQLAAALAGLGALTAELSEGVCALAVPRIIEAVAEMLGSARPSPLLDRRGIARHLGVSLATLDRLLAEGMPELEIGPRF